MERNVTVTEAVDLHNKTKDAYNISSELSNIIHDKLMNLEIHQAIIITQCIKLYITEIETKLYKNTKEHWESKKIKK